MPDGALLAAGDANGRVTPGDTCGPAVAAAGVCDMVLAVAAVGVASSAGDSGSVLAVAASVVTDPAPDGSVSERA
jgi:hypothetical protein